jgi:ABC-type glycerol-3-phosphate transport system substrate-binding protein
MEAVAARTARPGRAGRTRRRLARAAAGGAGALAAACGAAGGADPAGGPGATAGRPATIKWHTRKTTVQPEAYDPWLARWSEAHPQLTVDTALIGGSGPDKEQVLALAAAGTPPDVISPYNGAYQVIDLIQPVDDLVRRDRFDVRRFPAKTFDVSARYDGKVYTLPYAYGGDALVMVYNRKLLLEAGVREPAADWKAAWTWGDLREALRRTTRWDGDRPAQLGLGNFGYFMDTIPLPWGGQWLAPDYRSATCDSAAMVEAYTSYLQLVHGDRTTFQTPGVDARELTFLSGRAAVGTVCCGVLGTTRRYDEAGLDWAFAPLPRARPEPALSAILPVQIALMRGSKEREAAWTFVKWCVEQGRLAQLEQRLPNTPPLVEAWARQTWAGRPQVRPEVLAASPDYGFVDAVWLHPAQQVVEGKDAVIIQMWEEMLAQKRSPREALAEAKRLLQPVYDTYAARRPGG